MLRPHRSYLASELPEQIKGGIPGEENLDAYNRNVWNPQI
jgi:hypothetical protein